MLKSLVKSVAATSLMLAATAGHAEVRPAPTAFAIMINDDFVEEEPIGWLWAGVGVLGALGILVLMSGGNNGGGNNGGGNSPT